MAKISIDVDLSGEGFQEDEYGNFIPNEPIMDQVIQAVAGQLLTENFRKEFRDQVKKQIHSRISGIVDELIEEPIQEVDWAGNPKGEPRSVRKMLTDTLENWALQEPFEGDRYNRRASSLGAKVEEWVSEQTKNSLSRFMSSAESEIAEQVRKTAMEATVELFAKKVGNSK